MAKKASKAPKERVNIVYRPATNPAETVELPFKMLVLADLTGREDDTPIEERDPVRIDKDNFTAVLKAQNIKLGVQVRDRLTEEEGGTLSAELEFNSLRDFTPGGVAKQVPELAKLLELREALSALKSPLGNRRDFRKRIETVLGDADARARILKELGIKGSGE